MGLYRVNDTLHGALCVLQEYVTTNVDVHRKKPGAITTSCTCMRRLRRM